MLWIGLLVGWHFGAGTLEADLIWDGGGDGVSFFQEANWVDDVTGLDPPAGTVDGNSKISHNLVVNSGSIGGDFDSSSGVSANIVLDFNRKLTIHGGTLNLRNDLSVVGAAGEDFGFSSLQLNGGQMDTFNLHALQVDLTGDAELIVRSGTTTLSGNSSFNFASLDASIFFANKTAVQLIDEIAATTVFGQAAFVGQNLLVTDQSSGGALMQATVPEPSGLLLVALATAWLGLNWHSARRGGC